MPLNPATAAVPSSTFTFVTPARPNLGKGGMPSVSPAQRMAMATKAAQNFESFFVTSMMESMYAGMKPDKLFGGGSGEEMYRSLLNQEYGKVIAERDVLGIADEVRSEMLRSQEAH